MMYCEAPKAEEKVKNSGKDHIGMRQRSAMVLLCVEGGDCVNVCVTILMRRLSARRYNAIVQ